LPAFPEELGKLTQSLAERGWARVEQVGFSRKDLDNVHWEVSRLQYSEMESGQKSGGDFVFRNDRRVFIDTNHRKREDLPALNRLVGVLQGLGTRIGQELRSSPVRLRVTGNCKPMVACYEMGGFYMPHVDNGDADGRILTMVYYLNRDWRDAHGGTLRLHPEIERRVLVEGLSAQDLDRAVDLDPLEDSLAIFRADWMVHEVMPSSAPRRAVTIWFTGDYFV